MAQIVFLSILMVVVLPATCVFLQPSLTDIDFLSLDLTIFSISIALMIFTAPIMMKFRDLLLEMDAALMEKNKSIIEHCAKNIEYQKMLEADYPQESRKEAIETAEKRLLELTEKTKHHFPYSDIIQHYYEGLKDIMIWCFIAIVIHAIVNEVLFTSEPFIHFVKNDLFCITSGWDFVRIKNVISSYIKLASLSLQLFFLFKTCNDTFTTVLNFKSM